MRMQIFDHERKRLWIFTCAPFLPGRRQWAGDEEISPVHKMTKHGRGILDALHSKDNSWLYAVSQRNTRHFTCQRLGCCRIMSTINNDARAQLSCDRTVTERLEPRRPSR